MSSPVAFYFNSALVPKSGHRSLQLLFELTNAPSTNSLPPLQPPSRQLIPRMPGPLRRRAVQHHLQNSARCKSNPLRKVWLLWNLIDIRPRLLHLGLDCQDLSATCQSLRGCLGEASGQHQSCSLIPARLAEPLAAPRSLHEPTVQQHVEDQPARAPNMAKMESKAWNSVPNGSEYSSNIIKLDLQKISAFLAPHPVFSRPAPQLAARISGPQGDREAPKELPHHPELLSLQLPGQWPAGDPVKSEVQQPSPRFSYQSVENL